MTPVALITLRSDGAAAAESAASARAATASAVGGASPRAAASRNVPSASLMAATRVSCGHDPFCIASSTRSTDGNWLRRSGIGGSLRRRLRVRGSSSSLVDPHRITVDDKFQNPSLESLCEPAHTRTNPRPGGGPGGEWSSDDEPPRARIRPDPPTRHRRAELGVRQLDRRPLVYDVRHRRPRGRGREHAEPGRPRAFGVHRVVRRSAEEHRQDVRGRCCQLCARVGRSGRPRGHRQDAGRGRDDQGSPCHPQRNLDRRDEPARGDRA